MKYTGYNLLIINTGFAGFSTVWPNNEHPLGLFTISLPHLHQS